MTNEELTSAFEALRTAHRQQPASTLRERRALLADMLCGLRDHEDALLEALHQDLGKPEAEARLTEFFPIRKEIAFMRKHLGDWMRPERRPTPIQLLGTRSEIVNQPKGVVLVIAPWNFPLLLTMKPVIAALAAGNRVMVKPPEQAPATSQVMAEWMQASLPADRVQVLLGGPEEAAHLTTLPFDHIFFTGGTVTGRKVIRAAAEHLTPLTLELGGKSPAIIDGTMNPDLVAGRVGWAKALNVGQVCIAPDYLLMKDTAVDDMVAALARRWDGWFGEDKSASDSYGRVVNEGQFDRLVETLEDAVSKGATIAHGGRHDRGSRFMEPTILTGVTPDMRVMQEEVFGPLLPVLSWSDPLEVPGRVADVKDHPLSLYIFSTDKKRVRQWLAATRSGTVGIGETIVQIANPDLPFGGVQASGAGRSNGRASFDEFSNRRSVLRKRLPLTAVPLSFPPFGPAKEALAKWISRHL
ncbi:MAG: aldehyde dehydrogenase family protein [Bacteroidota bacterium]|nr:aldehyde dehydrogenase family protein [Bacteroidota bacterium]